MSDYTELMTLGICHRLPLHAIGGYGVPIRVAPCLEMVNMANRIVRMHVEMHAVLADLRLWDGLQDQDGPGWLILKRYKDSVAVGGFDQVVSESCLPEWHQGIGIAAVQHDRNSHEATLRLPRRRRQAPVSRASRSASVSRRITT